MKRLTYITLSLVAGLALLFTSCKNMDFGDLNQPEYAVMSAEPASLLAGGAMSYGAIAGRLYSTNYAFYVQWMTQGIYDDEQRYANFQGAWAAYYTGPLANIEEALQMSSDTTLRTDMVFTQTNGYVDNVRAFGLLMKAIVFKRITDIFGAIPMSEALDPQNITPKYDTQEEVYNNLISMLKEARSLLDNTQPGCKGDIFYGGDVDKLRKLINSVLMEVAIQLSEVNEQLAEETFVDAYNDGGITDVADEAWYFFRNVRGMQNPWSRLRYSDYYTSLQMWASMLAYDTTDAEGNSARVTSNHAVDYRIFAVTDDPGVPGEDYMALSKDEGYGSPWSELFLNPALPLPEMTAAYTWLNIAEAAARGWISDVTVGDALRNAILASFASYDTYWNLTTKRGIAAADWSSAANYYATVRVSDLATVDTLQLIGEEKWVALYPIPWKAWSEWRRTGWPHIHPLPANKTYNGGHIPTRYRYPAEEINLNNQHYLEGVQDLTPKEDQNYSRVWWDVTIYTDK